MFFQFFRSCNRIISRRIAPQVASRFGYKGAMREADSMRSLPLDAATVLGMICIFGSILPAQCLSSEALKSSAETLVALSEFMSLSEFLPLVPENPALALKITDNMVKRHHIESLLKSLQLDASRPSGFHVQTDSMSANK